MQALLIAQELAQLKHLGVRIMRLCKGLHPLQQHLSRGISCTQEHVHFHKRPMKATAWRTV